MDKTKIEWCDATWNPLTGCRHGCEYCYARRIADRFSGYDPQYGSGLTQDKNGNFELGADEKKYKYNPEKRNKEIAPYPFGFEPTFYGYRLDQPKKWKEPRTIFVCSMADLFGAWVPDKWIKAVFDACSSAPQHRYVFLTKNPRRYCDLHRKGILPDSDNYWFGATFDHCNWTGQEEPERPATFSLLGETIHDAGDYYFPTYPKKHRIVCFEPLRQDFWPIERIGAEWVIIGAETGNHKEKSKPQKEWVDVICEVADKEGAAVFMKDSLIPTIGEENMRREFPWETKEADENEI